MLAVVLAARSMLRNCNECLKLFVRLLRPFIAWHIHSALPVSARHIRCLTSWLIPSTSLRTFAFEFERDASELESMWCSDRMERSKDVFISSRFAIDGEFSSEKRYPSITFADRHLVARDFVREEAPKNRLEPPRRFTGRFKLELLLSKYVRAQKWFWWAVRALRNDSNSVATVNPALCG